ncbi:MAG: HTH-type transcriptional regulator MalT [Desulfovibrio sp.]
MLQPETRILQRDAISETLTEALLRYPLVALTAPMGYGKTTAARELLRSFPHRAVYLAMPMESHNSFYLWDRACGQAIAQDAKVAGALQRMGFPSDPVQVQKAIDRLRAGLEKYPVLVIVDDYHYVDIPELDTFIEAVARENIPGLGVLLISRSRPRIPLEELRVKRLAVHFGHELLTFSEEDAVAYFALNGIADKRTAGKAWSHAEGWPAALWLSLQNCIANGVTANARDLEETLWRTVYSKYGHADKKLLLQLSIFESFTPRQAVSASGDEGAPRRLRVLHDQNALIAYDPATDSYRLHSIFRTFLERVLFDRMDDVAAEVDLPALYRRAGEWYAIEGDTLQAMRFFFKAGDDAGHLRALELCETPESTPRIFMNPASFADQMAMIPWSVKTKQPVGYLAFIYHFMTRTDRETGLALAREAEKEFLKPGTLPPQLRRRVKGELECIYAGTAFNDFRAIGEHHKNAHALLGGKSSIAHRDLIWTFGCPHLAFNYLREPGEYDALIGFSNDFWRFFQELSGGCAVGAQDLCLAELLLERHSLKKVEPLIMKGVYRANAREQLATLVAGHFAQARLSLALGNDAPDAAEALEELKTRIMRTNNPLLVFTFDLAAGYIAAVRGQPENIPAWLKRGNVSAMPYFYQSANFVSVVHGKALLANEDWPALEALAQDMPVDAPNESLMGRIHAKIMHAVAARNLHGENEARPLFAEAVALARPDKLVLIFAEYGAHIAPLIAAQKNAASDAFLAHIKKAAAVYAKKGKNAAMGLAPREAAVLELAVSGKLNNEIAVALGIKPVTVGNTLSRVYKKLGVQNRTEAALIWRKR